VYFEAELEFIMIYVYESEKKKYPIAANTKQYKRIMSQVTTPAQYLKNMR
jgi:hypothetical protein